MADRYIKELQKKSLKKFALDKYRESDIKITHRSFEGTPKKNPRDNTVLILLADPFKKNKEFYEFTIDSIGQIEELGTITNRDGQSALRVRIWVKKGIPAIKAKSFIVR